MLVKPEDRTIVGTLPGTAYKAKIDEDSAVHLMDLLGKGIYNDPEMAVLREYACNARDSHDEAGNTAPIEISLPSTLSPFLKIIDHGVGLSSDEAIRFLTYYGASTKRVEGNTQTGSLGIGGKSGFAYGDQFNIIAIKNGRKTTISASRDEEGGGEFTIVDESDTDEPNGVEIQIPAKRWNEFSAKASQLFKYWRKGSVLVNGAEPTPITEATGVERVTDDLFLTQNDFNNESVLVMCNVPYKVPTTEFGVDLGHNRQMVAYVNVDAVDFAGNREQLRMTKKTKTTLTTLGQQFKDEMLKAMQTEIDACASPIEAIRKATKWYLATPETMRPDSWTYKGKEIPKEFAIGQPDEYGQRPRMVVVKRNSTKQKAHSKDAVIPFTTAIKAQWFYGYDLEFTTGHRRRIDEWASRRWAADPTNWTYPEIYILTDKKIVSEYLDDDRIADWEEVRSVKMPSTERSEYGRLLGSYDTLVGGGGYAEEKRAEHIDDAEPIYYYVGESNKNCRWTQSRTQRALPYHNVLRLVEPNCTTILIPATREAKLLRTFPQAQKAQDAVQGLFKEWVDGLTTKELEVLYIFEEHSDAHNMITALDDTRVTDPQLSKLIKLLKLTDVSTHSQQLHYYQRVDARNSVIKGSFTNPLKRYPLYSSVYMTHNGQSDHLYLYLNAAYAAAQAEAAAAVEELVAQAAAEVAEEMAA